MASIIRVFSAPKEMLRVKGQWNELIHDQSENPFLLTGFVEQFLKSSIDEPRKNLLLICLAGQKIVGVAPPITIIPWRGIFKVANFLFDDYFDTDFVVQEEYREDFLYQAVDFLFRKAGCNLINISLPSGTKNLRILRNVTKELGAYALTRLGADHTVLPVEKPWIEFEKDRGRNFRRFFRKIERKMGLAGTWRILISTKEDYESEILKDILEIEESSWKQGYRNQRGLENDESLLRLWKGAFSSSLEKGFNWQVAFLELNGKKIAYSFWVEYKDAAFICKTSFDQRYRQYYPGIYVNNVAVRTLFDTQLTKQIDFMTDLPFHERWTAESRPRFRLTISKSPVPIMIANLLGSQVFRSIRSSVNAINARAGESSIPATERE